MRKKRIKHNDLSWYFMRPREELPAAYVRSCEKFFKELSHKRQASSSKRQASSTKQQAPAGLNSATIK
jgi:hypothetical protein